MKNFFIVEADGILLFRTASTSEENANKYYNEELKKHTYNNVTLVEYTRNKPLRTTDIESAKEGDLKVDKFKK